MIVRLLALAVSALAGALGTLFLRERVIGGDPGAPPLPEYAYRPRSRRAARTHLDWHPDGAGVPQ